MFLIAAILFLSAQIAFGQEVGQTLFEGPVGPDNPLCSIIEQAGMTWPIFGQAFGMLTAAALFLRPFSSVLMKVALALTSMPSPAAKTLGKVLWVLGTFAAVPAAGTPKMMQKVIKGEIESPIKKKAA